MSLFREAGKKFEETKRTIVGEAGEEYVCRSCEEPLAEGYQYCPHCGETSVEPME